MTRIIPLLGVLLIGCATTQPKPECPPCPDMLVQWPEFMWDLYPCGCVYPD